MSLLDAHVAIAKESTFGTPVTTGTGLLIDPKDWSLEPAWENVPSMVRLPGQETPTTSFSRSFMGMKGAGSGEILDKTQGILLELMFGSLTSAVSPLDAALNRFTLIPSATGKYGKSATLQLFKPYVDTTGEAETTDGVKVVGFTLSCDIGGNLRYGVTLDGRDYVTSGRVVTSATTNGSANVTVASTVGIAVGMTVVGTGIPASTVVRSITSATVFTLGDAAGAAVLATVTNATAALTITRGTAIAKAVPTYASNAQPYAWNGVSVLTLDGQAAACTGFELSWQSGIKTDRHFLGAAPKLEQIADGSLSTATLTLKGMEFLATNRQRDRFNSLTSATSLAAFAVTLKTATPSVNGAKSEFTITIPTAQASSGPPDMRGGQPASFNILNSMTALYDTIDAAP